MRRWQIKTNQPFLHACSARDPPSYPGWDPFVCHMHFLSSVIRMRDFDGLWSNRSVTFDPPFLCVLKLRIPRCTKCLPSLILPEFMQLNPYP